MFNKNSKYKLSEARKWRFSVGYTFRPILASQTVLPHLGTAHAEIIIKIHSRPMRTSVCPRFALQLWPNVRTEPCMPRLQPPEKADLQVSAFTDFHFFQVLFKPRLTWHVITVTHTESQCETPRDPAKPHVTRLRESQCETPRDPAVGEPV